MPSEPILRRFISSAMAPTQNVMSVQSLMDGDKKIE